MAKKLTGSEIIIKSLLDAGIDTIFGYPGGAVLPLYDAIFKQNRLRHILVRHEQGAIHAAEGYARSTGKVGAVLVTSGPGATNVVTGLTDAMMDSIPIICITGQVATHLIGYDAFQEADTVGITRACTKYNYLIKDADAVAKTMQEAIYIAKTGRPGPVVVDVPKNVLNAETTKYEEKYIPRKSYKVAKKGDEKAIAKAVKLLANAKRPVIYAGGGIINSGEKACKNLHKLVKLTGFPITETLMGLGAYPANEPEFLGMLGMHGSLEANMCMHDCDVMLNIGARFDDRVTGNISKFSPKSKKIHVDIDKSSINKCIKVDIPIVGDANEVIQQIMAEWKKQKYTKPDISSWWKKIAAWRKKESFRYTQGTKIIKPQHALRRLDAIASKLKKDFYVTTDVGQHQMWAAQHIKYNKPYRWMTSGGLGTMGYGMPSAMGVQVAHPKSLVVCVSGEASIMMCIQELSTIKQYRLPVKVMVLNNHYMGMVRQWQEMFHGNRYSESYMDALPDFVALAESFGIKGLRANNLDELDDTLTEMIKHDGPVFCDIVVDDKENVYPMIPAGAGHHELLLSPDDAKPDVSSKEARNAV
ncbi:MAG: acetolactate synthase, large subunit, biosynthetic type [Alphaproteobacteria bacterium CG11_big_fil_rev_8_21_14_0_20_44_7]|nr:MAG: acetolactate synthase, large subunit, biosynthetic type [Alphaproteobacteria bacterium CG11_big_fil_rev_8_21_14_0_20_44_7]